MFKKEVVNLLKKHISIKEQEIESLIEIPPDEKLGDYAFPCFTLAKQFKKAPQEIAKELASKLKTGKEIEKIQVDGAYINFFINKKLIAEEIIKIDENYGKIKAGEKGKQKIMVEFPSPNTNKPLHLGHLRNMSIGESVSRLLEFAGNKVIRANLNNDRGIHICKSMLAYEKYGKGKNPEKAGKKSDHFVGDYYVLFNQKAKENPELEKEAQECLVKWEKGDKKTLEIWKKMNKWALQGFNETYKLFGIKFDKEYFESKTYKQGKKIAEEGLKKEIFQKRSDGAIVIELGKQGNEELGEKVILRADGTAVYITQDLALAKLKSQDYSLDGSIYVTGNEQDYHFKVLFLVLKKLGFKFSGNLHHLSYGMVELPEGKMKSREGKVVEADELIKETQELAKNELEKRYKLTKQELEKRSLKIALAAIKYSLLKIDIAKNMLFNPEESVSFEGDTGPYLQYSYARASSILRKAGNKAKQTTKNKKIEIKELAPQEIELIKKISQFPEQIKQASFSLNPSLIANYSFELAQIFNEFYHSCPVINSEQEAFRLKLVEAFKTTIKNSLYLLGIEIMEEM